MTALLSKLGAALAQVQNPNLQDMGSMRHPVTAQGWSDYSKGLPAGVAGIPGDLAGLIGALMQAKQGKPIQSIDFNSPYGTDALGKAMGANVESPQFMLGSIGLPGLEDMLRPAAAGAAITGGIAAFNKLAGLKQGDNADELIGALMARNAPGADVAMTGYHGTPHKLPPEPGHPLGRFRSDKIGTGEGAQAYGHGLYFAESPGVAKTYRKQHDAVTTARSAMIRNGENVDKALDETRGLLKQYEDGTSPPGGLPPDRQASLVAIQKEKIAELEHFKKTGKWKKGHLYEVDIPDEQIDKMLDWDAPLSEQPEIVKKLDNALIIYPYDAKTGEDVYQAIAKNNHPMGGRNTPEASNLLNEAGIPGIKYLDGTSRSAGEGTRNFVVFDEDTVKVLKRDGEDVLPLDEASRMARARDMGWDKDMYHGTDSWNDFTEFDNRRLGTATEHPQGRLGHFVAPDPELAGRFGHGDGKRILPLKIAGNYYDMTLDDFYKINRQTSDQEIWRIKRSIEDQGFDGIRLVEASKGSDVDKYDFDIELGTHIVFDPKNIRSRFAKFDPAKKDSANLMAGAAGGGLVAALMAQQQQ